MGMAEFAVRVIMQRKWRSYAENRRRLLWTYIGHYVIIIFKKENKVAFLKSEGSIAIYI